MVIGVMTILLVLGMAYAVTKLRKRQWLEAGAALLESLGLYLMLLGALEWNSGLSFLAGVVLVPVGFALEFTAWWKGRKSTAVQPSGAARASR